MIVYLIFLSLSLLWLFILFLGPYLSGNEYNLLQEIYYQAFKIICHQNPERSYFVWEHQMPVCARCFGIYAGILVGAVIYPLFKKLNSTQIPKFKYLLIFLAPLVFDGIFQTLGLYKSSNHIRLFTGILGTSALVFYFLPLLNQIYNRFKNEK